MNVYTSVYLFKVAPSSLDEGVSYILVKLNFSKKK